MKKQTLIICLAATLALPVSCLHAEEVKPSDSEPKTQQQVAPVYLGVVVGPVPQAVQAQLPEDIIHNQGLMVMRVIPDSPAASAGLKAHDVLLSFGGNTLISPDDLIKAVNKGKAGDKASMQILRHGKVMDINATLAARKRAAYQSPLMMPHAAQTAPGNEVMVRKSYQSIRVNRLPDGNYNAMIEFLDAGGNMKKYEYEGSGDDLRKQIKSEKGLPDAQKQQLLNTLNGNPARVPMRGMPDIREFERGFFNPPPWAMPYRPNFWD
jgi:membrane-associated protease RseP (regulator of RpoE activity)